MHAQASFCDLSLWFYNAILILRVVKVVEGVVYHSRPVHVVNFAIASLKRVDMQKRQILPCNLQGLHCTK